MCVESDPESSGVLETDGQLDALLRGAERRLGAEGSEPVSAAAAWLRTSTAPARSLIQGVRAASDLLRMCQSGPVVATALLAATEPLVEPDRLPEGLGKATRELLRGLARVRTVRWHELSKEEPENLRGAFLAMAQDVRVVVVELALQCQAALHLGELPEAEQRRQAQVGLNIYAPLASRLGIWRFKSKIEDASFAVLEPDTFRELSLCLDRGQPAREEYLGRVRRQLTEALHAARIDAAVSGRAKHLYSIRNKMQRKAVAFDRVKDISALRVIVSGVAECYAALGIVHSLWSPVHRAIDDYIAMPKGNGYQSLHTAVVGPEGRSFEVQIRTQQMHEYAEYGVAAHWAYKEGQQLSAAAAAEDRFTLLRRLLEWESASLESACLPTDLFTDQVFVFTPKSEVVDLPVGATPLDFAYRVHTMLGHRCRGARVNDQIAPLTYKLRTGDRVEILTQREPSPRRDWMNPGHGYLLTASARAKVRTWFRKQGREEALEAGRELLSAELARAGVSEVDLSAIAQALHYRTLDDLILAVGYGERRPKSVVEAALRAAAAAAPPPPPSSPAAAPSPPRGVVLDGVEDIWGKRAQCCRPMPGEPVLGFISRGRGLVLHRRDCPQLRAAQEPERVVEVDWGRAEGELHGVELEARLAPGSDRVADLLRRVGQLGGRLLSSSTRIDGDGDTRVSMLVQCRDAIHVAGLLERVSQVEGLRSLRRVG